MNYIKAWDSLRAIAVFLVIIWHWLGKSNGLNNFPNGPMGVVIFFVLSGFLITRILLEGRNKIESAGSSKMIFFKNFYIRRSLRIFPLYYIVVGAFFIYSILNHEYLTKYFYFFTYTSNYYFIKIEAWDNYLSHLWTLAVEEQFYLIWPLIVLRVNKKYLLHSIILFIAIGVIGQIIAGGGWQEFSTICCFDSLGSGALLAWITVYKPKYLKSIYRITGIISIVVAILFYYQVVVLKNILFPFRIQASVISLFVVSYIVYTWYNKIKLPFILNIILNNNFLASIGKISYGLYIYHILISNLWRIKFFSDLYGHLPSFMVHKPRYFHIVNFIVLLVVSFLSWKFIEKPILSLKRTFQLKEKAAGTAREVGLVS